MKHIPYKEIKWQSATDPGVFKSEIHEHNEEGGIRYWSLKKGAGFDKHNHKGYEYIFVVKGAIDFSSKIVKAGGLLITLRNEAHEAIALEDSVILVVNERNNH